MSVKPGVGVRIVEVGPRDGLQNVRQSVPTDVKISLIQQLHATGLTNIELTSFVSPKAVPQLKDGKAVLSSPVVRALLRDGSLRLPVLVPNIKGAQMATESSVREVAVFVSASEGFSKANINCTVDQGLERAAAVAKHAREHGLDVRGYVSCIISDPFDGPTPPAAVLSATQKLLAMGCYEVSLGDTLGVGSPAVVNRLLTYLADNGVPLDRLAGHFHDTYGQALANVWEAYNCGLRTFDSSVSGLGGCPFAPGAQGNVATEDLVYMFETAGIATGVDLDLLTQIGGWISQQLSRPTGSRAGAAIAAKKKVSAAAAAPAPKSSGSSLAWDLVRQTDGLLVHKSGVNLRITMNRPRNGNALTAAMMADLVAIFNEAATDASVHRIVLAGSGKFFCTGMDLGKDSTPVGAGGATADAQFDRLSTLFETIDRSPKVTIAAVNGPAFGGGVGLMFATDLRLCAKSARVTLSEVKLGLCPATISKYVVREWGFPLAREAMMTGRPVAPAEMLAKGLVVRVVEDDDPARLAAAVDEFVTSLKIASSDASRMSKDLVRAGWESAGKEQQAAEIRKLFHEMMQPDAPGAFGVQKFQKGEKVDWDTYRPDRPSSKL